jgi:hypothetical protein
MLQVAFFSFLTYFATSVGTHTMAAHQVSHTCNFCYYLPPSLTKPMAICIDNLLFTLGHGSNVLDVYSMG